MVSTPSIYGILLEGTWKRSVKGYDSFFWWNNIWYDSFVKSAEVPLNPHEQRSFLVQDFLDDVSFSPIHSGQALLLRSSSRLARFHGRKIRHGKSQDVWYIFFLAISNLCLDFLLLHDCLDPRFNTLSFQPANVSGLIVIFKFFRKGGSWNLDIKVN